MQESNYWKRLRSARMTRRYLLRGAATTAAGGAAAMIVGCGGGGSSGLDFDPAAYANQDPIAGGSLTFGRSINALGIDPHVDLTALDIDTLLYSYMYGWAPSTEEIILNNLAANFEQPDPDHLQFIFTLNKGVKVAPNAPVGAGEDITSEDCKQSFARRGTSISAPDKRFTKYIAGQVDKTLLLEHLETPDPYIFRFEMTEPFVPAIREMANPTWAIVPAKILEEYTSLSQDAFGSGPFMLEEFRGGERIALAKNPDYFIPDRPYLDAINYVIITENSSLLTAFRAGQHDVNGSFLTRRDADNLMDDPRITVASAPTLFYPVIQMKIKPPFSDIRVRKAVDRAINRQAIIDGPWEGQGSYNGPIQWFQQNWSLSQEELREKQKYDPEEARQLLVDAGYPDGFDVTMKIPQLQGITFILDIALLIQQQLKEVNIRVSVDQVELGAYIGNVILPGNFEMTFFPNLPYDEPDRPLAFYHSLGVTGNGNWTNYNNQDLDPLIDAQAQEFDVEKRKEIIDEAQRMILDEYGPQLTLPGGFQFASRWAYVRYPFEFFEDPTSPNGVDIWTYKDLLTGGSGAA